MITLTIFPLHFRLSAEVANALKSLFILFANDFIQNAANLLTESHTGDLPVEKSILLIESIVNTLHHVFLHDSQGFTNSARFDILMQPLVDQIENDFVLKSASTKPLLQNCLAQFGIAVNDDTLWKRLNYQILVKTRSEEPEIK